MATTTVTYKQDIYIKCLHNPSNLEIKISQHQPFDANMNEGPFPHAIPSEIASTIESAQLHYTFYGIQCHMCSCVTHPILRRTLGYTNIQQLQH